MNWCINPATKFDYVGIVKELEDKNHHFDVEKPTEEEYDAGQIMVYNVTEEEIDQMNKRHQFDHFEID